MTAEEPAAEEAAPRVLRVSRSLAVPLDELEWRFTGSGGPGGQHANTSNTRVELRFSIENSRALGPRQRARLLERLGPTVRVVAADERSQHRNRELALGRLATRLAAALVEAPTRVQTKPTRGSSERRLAAKHRHGETKRLRQQGDDDS